MVELVYRCAYLRECEVNYSTHGLTQAFPAHCNYAPNIKTSLCVMNNSDSLTTADDACQGTTDWVPGLFNQ